MWDVGSENISSINGGLMKTCPNCQSINIITYNVHKQTSSGDPIGTIDKCKDCWHEWNWTPSGYLPMMAK